MESTRSKRRIRHIYSHDGPAPDWGRHPRGWITAEGRFLETKEHWKSITHEFRRPDTRGALTHAGPEEVEGGERIAQLAYSLGWISLGHAGELNAIGHERTFRSFQNAALMTLQKLLADSPSLTIQIELQLGFFDPSSGVHEDYDVREYDLDRFLRRGRLIEASKAGI